MHPQILELNSFKEMIESGMVLCVFNPNIPEVEAGGSPSSRPTCYILASSHNQDCIEEVLSLKQAGPGKASRANEMTS